MKKTILLLISIFSNFSFSQELAGELNLKLHDKRNIFQIVDELKKQVALFISDENGVSSYKFNNEFKVIDSLKSKRPDDKFKSMIGYASKDDKYRVFWSSNKNKEINSQCFDFESKKVTNEVFKFDFSKEQIIQQITINNNFYIISLVKDTSILKMYIFDNDGKTDTKTIDASSYTLIDSYGENVSLFDAFKEEFLPFEDRFSLKHVSSETPTSLTFAAYKRKIYTTPSEIVFAFDTNTKFTQLFKINLTDFSISRKMINQSTEDFPKEQEVYDREQFESKPDVNSNSFIVKNKIFQIKLCPYLVKISVKDLDGNVIKEFSAKPDQPIEFKNSEIIQESGDIKSRRVLETSNQFIRKLYNSNPGITFFEKNGNYYATVGSASQVMQDASGAVIGGALFGMAGILIAAALTANQNVENYNSYKNRKIVYINSMFDNDFNHLNGDLKPLAFDQLREFATENKKNSDLTIFKFNSYLYLGAYNKKNKTYSFNRFAE